MSIQIQNSMFEILIKNVKIKFRILYYIINNHGWN